MGTIIKKLGGIVFVAVLIAAVGSPAWGDEVNLKKTTFTFSAPVELPGLALPAGTYVFRLAETASNHNIVQVFDKNQKHAYGSFIAIPTYRAEPSDKTIVRFSETAAGGPRAVKEWFYPGNPYGLEFVYPKSKAAEIAKATNEPVPSMPENLVPEVRKPNIQTLLNAPLKVEEPSGEEVEVAEAFPTQAPAEAPAATHNVNTEAPLPKTASMFPLLALLGFSMVTAGTLLSLIRLSTVKS